MLYLLRMILVQRLEMSKACCVEGFLLMADLEQRGRGYIMRIVYFHARMNLPNFYGLLSIMPKVKLVDSKCIEKVVLYCLLRCLLPTRRIIPARKRLFRTWVSTCAYHGIIFLHVICWALCEFGMWCYLHDLKIATKENHWLDQSLLSQFVVSRKRVGLGRF